MSDSQFGDVAVLQNQHSYMSAWRVRLPVCGCYANDLHIVVGPGHHGHDDSSSPEEHADVSMLTSLASCCR